MLNQEILQITGTNLRDNKDLPEIIKHIENNRYINRFELIFELYCSDVSACMEYFDCFDRIFIWSDVPFASIKGEMYDLYQRGYFDSDTWTETERNKIVFCQEVSVDDGNYDDIRYILDSCGGLDVICKIKPPVVKNEEELIDYYKRVKVNYLKLQDVLFELDCKPILDSRQIPLCMFTGDELFFILFRKSQWYTTFGKKIIDTYIYSNLDASLTVNEQRITYDVNLAGRQIGIKVFDDLYKDVLDAIKNPYLSICEGCPLKKYNVCDGGMYVKYE